MAEVISSSEAEGINKQERDIVIAILNSFRSKLVKDEEDIKKESFYEELSEKMNNNKNHQMTNEEKDAISGYTSKRMPINCYNEAKEDLEASELQYGVTISEDGQTFIITVPNEEQEKLESLTESINNRVEQNKTLSLENLKAYARTEHEEIVGLSGLSTQDMEMLEKRSNGFSYTIDHNAGCVYTLSRHGAALKTALVMNQMALSMRTGEQKTLDEISEKNNYYNTVYSKNGKVSYLCSGDKDLSIKIRNDDFEVIKDGKSVRTGAPGEYERTEDGVTHYIVPKTATITDNSTKQTREINNLKLLSEYKSTMGLSVMLSDKEYIGNFDARKGAMERKIGTKIPENYEQYGLDRTISTIQRLNREEIERQTKNASMGSIDQQLNERGNRIYDFTVEVLEAKGEDELDDKKINELKDKYKDLNQPYIVEMLVYANGCTPEAAKDRYASLRESSLVDTFTDGLYTAVDCTNINDDLNLGGSGREFNVGERDDDELDRE